MARIGIDGRLWNETGVGRYIRSLYRYLPEFDQENEYVWFFRKEEFDSLKLPSNKWRKVRTDIRWHTLREQLFLPVVFARENLDLLHFPYFSFPIFYPRKFVITIHDLILDHYKTGQWSTLPHWLFLVKKAGYHLVNWVSVWRAQKILTLSEDAKKELVAHYRADPKKVIAIHEAGALEDRRTNFTGREFDQMRHLQPYLLYVGNVHQHKNVENLIRAIHLIRQRHPELRLVLVGTDPFFYPRLTNWITANHFAADAVIIGGVPNTEIGAWYHFASAFVTASLMEGFGIPPLEAMSVGCPVLVSDIPVFHEVYSGAATYFDPESPETIAEVITKTLADKKPLARQIQRGYQQVAKYSWEELVKQTARVYSSVLVPNS